MKNILWGIIVLAISSYITCRLVAMYFYFIAATNDTTAPIAAFLTAIPVALFIFQAAVYVVKHFVKGFRQILLSIA